MEWSDLVKVIGSKYQEMVTPVKDGAEYDCTYIVSSVIF